MQKATIEQVQDLAKFFNGEVLTATSRAAQAWGERLSAAVHTTPISLRKWTGIFKTLDTLQVSYSDEGKVLWAWGPGERRLERYATYMELDESRRDYASLVHVAHSTLVWVGWDAGMRTLVVYYGRS